MKLTELFIILLCVSVLILFRAHQRRKAGLESARERIARIRYTGFWGQCFTLLSIVIGLYWLLAFLFEWPFLFQDKVRVVVAQNHIYDSPGQMPQTLLMLWLAKMVVGMAGTGALALLFNLYRNGIAFSAKNVRLIRCLGYALIAGWVVDYLMQSQLKAVALSMTPLLAGQLVIFVSWIMDEGRQLQEEQALTV